MEHQKKALRRKCFFLSDPKDWYVIAVGDGITPAVRHIEIQNI